MDDAKNLKAYLELIVDYFIEDAREAKKSASLAKDNDKKKFEEGRKMAFYDILTTMIQHAKPQGIDLKEIGLDKIDPDKDLIP